MSTKAPTKFRLVRDEIRTALGALTTPGQTFEVRAIFKGTGARSEVCHSADEGADAAIHFKNAKGIYFTLNPLRDDLDGAAKDDDVLERQRLLVDVDPVRVDTPGECGATDDEKQAAIELARAIRDHLTALGWGRPAFIDSGNGAHLIYSIELPNDAASRDLVKAVLVELARRFDTDKAKVDTSVFNAARISKLPATVVRKGEDDPTRPYRVARLIDDPGTAEIVTRGMLEALVPRGAFTRKAKDPGPPTMTKEEYGRDELRKELGQFASQRHPGRHADLLRCTLSLAGLVKAKALDEQDVIRGLHDAARDNGMEKEGRIPEVDEAWRSAMLKANARAMPIHVGTPTKGKPFDKRSPHGWERIRDGPARGAGDEAGQRIQGPPGQVPRWRDAPREAPRDSGGRGHRQGDERGGHRCRPDERAADAGHRVCGSAAGRGPDDRRRGWL